jgi:hypothetical protein
MNKPIIKTASALKNESIRQLCAQGKTKKEAKEAYKILLGQAQRNMPEGQRIVVFFIESWEQENLQATVYCDWEFTDDGYLKTSLPQFKEVNGKRLKDSFLEPVKGATIFNALGKVAADSVRKECIELLSAYEGSSKEEAAYTYDKMFEVAKAESGLDLWALDCAYNPATGKLDYAIWR